MQHFYTCGAGPADVRPEPPQIVELVAAAGIGERQRVKVVVCKELLERGAVGRAVQLVKAVVRQRVRRPDKVGFQRQLGIFLRAQHGRCDSVQVKEEVFLQPRAVERRQTDDEGLGEILAHPVFQLQAVFAVGGQSVRQGGIVLIFAAAVRPDGDGGDQHQLLRRDPAQVFPRGTHDGKVCLRVSVGQKHGGGHPGVDTKLRPGAVLRGNIAAVAGCGKCMLCRQIAPHEPCGADKQINGHGSFPFAHLYKIHYSVSQRKKQRPAQNRAGRCR